MHINLTALIVTHNRLDKLKTTLEKTLAQNFHQVVVINCGSTDGTRNFLNTLKSKKIIVRHIENLGGAGGFAYGADFIINRLTTDWVVFFDDDAYPDKRLIASFKRMELDGCHVISSHVYNKRDILPPMNTPVKLYPHTLKQLFSYVFLKNETLIGPQDLEKKATRIESASFVGLFVRFDVLKQTHHNIRSDLFIYYDDLFYTQSLFKAGYDLWFMPDLKFFHDTPSQHAPAAWKIYFLSKNIFCMKQFSTRPAFWTLALVKLLKIGGIILKKNSILPGLKLFGIGIIDGLNQTNRFSRINPVKEIIEYAFTK